MRGVLGIIAGAIAWMLVFYALAVGLALTWPDYALQARAWQTQRLFAFTPPMACLNLLFWVIADMGAGWLTTVIAKRREATWALAAMLGIYLASVHMVLDWSRFPWWYNLAVIIPAIPAVLLGGWLAGAHRSEAGLSPATGPR